MSGRGRFITLEGIEGAGKSTVAARLRDMLREHGVRVELTREPGGTPLAEQLRELVLQRSQEPLDAEAETLLMFAARRIHLSNRIRPALEQGCWVICDRFTDATRAYQGGGRGVDRNWIETLAAGVHAGLEPDLTLLLDLPVELGLARAQERRRAAGILQDDRFESEHREFFERVRGEYLRLLGQPHTAMWRIDASASIEEVARETEAAVRARFASELARA